MLHWGSRSICLSQNIQHFSNESFTILFFLPLSSLLVSLTVAHIHKIKSSNSQFITRLWIRTLFRCSHVAVAQFVFRKNTQGFNIEFHHITVKIQLCLTHPAYWFAWGIFLSNNQPSLSQPFFHQGISELFSMFELQTNRPSGCRLVPLHLADA